MKSMLWPVLGLARFGLALVVAGSHLAWFTDKSDPARILGHFSGLVAVLGFLVISGYSIAASFERDQSEFYYRRALRILPQYVLLVVISAVLPLLFVQGLSFVGTPLPAPTYAQLFLNLCFAEGFITGNIETNPVLWTLALEVFFYACTPWLARLSNRSLLILGSVGALCYVNAASFVSLHYPTELWGINVVLLGWAWILGFWVYRAKGPAIDVALMIGVFALTLNHTGIDKWWLFTWVLPLLAVRFASRLPYHERIARLFLLLGDVSYPLYLVHFPLYLALAALGCPRHGILLLAAAVTTATILDFAFDRPVKRIVNDTRARLQSASREARNRFTSATNAVPR